MNPIETARPPALFALRPPRRALFVRFARPCLFASLALCLACGAEKRPDATPAAPAGPPGPRTVRFDPDRSIGLLLTKDWGGARGPKKFALARGDVNVPARQELWLHANSKATEFPDAFSGLRASDLQGIVFAGVKQMDDRGLAHLSGLTALRELDLAQAAITDRGMVHLRDMKSLRRLNLPGARIGNAGMEALRGMTALESLTIGGEGSMFTSAGLEAIMELKALKELRIGSAKLTVGGVRRLEKALPDCRITITHPTALGRLYGFRTPTPTPRPAVS